jgi:hypothetical protein
MGLPSQPSINRQPAWLVSGVDGQLVDVFVVGVGTCM